MTLDKVRPGLFPLFGNWFLDTNGDVVSLNLGAHEDAYWIPLDQWDSGEAAARWIMHYGNKRALKSAELGDFLKSVTFLFGDEPITWDEPELRAVKSVVYTPLPSEETSPPANANGFAFRTLSQALDDDARVLRERRETDRYVLGSRGARLLKAGAP